MRFCCCLALALSVGPASAQIQPPPFQIPKVNVLTERYDHYRTGANTGEATLNTRNVGPTTFGKLFARQVDGQVYAQPLVVTVASRSLFRLTRDLLIVCTAHNTVYAFDADDPAASAPLWKYNLGPSAPWTDWGVLDVNPEVGMISTPAIDPQTGILYVVAKVKFLGNYYIILHAIDVRSGADTPASPVLVGGSVKGTGDGSDGTNVYFNPYYQQNRPGLLLDHGLLYIGFASHGDTRPYHGWLFAYDPATLAQKAIYCSTNNGGLGGIWQAGGGIASDASGDIYFATGNGDFTHDTTGGMTGNSVVHLAGGTLAVTDFYTPHDSDFMNAFDIDLGSGGPTLIPKTNFIVQAGKDGSLYLIDRTNMGKFDPAADHNLQRFYTFPGTLWGNMVYWNSPNAGPSVYAWAEYDQCKQFQLTGGLLNQTPVNMTPTAASWGEPGGIISLSSWGSAPGTGILWASHPISDDANSTAVPGVLQAFDATDLTHELWDSEMNHDRDTLGLHAKFCPPVVANGRVYMATFSNQVVCYGLLRRIYPRTLDRIGPGPK